MKTLFKLKKEILLSGVLFLSLLGCENRDESVKFVQVDLTKEVEVSIKKFSKDLLVLTKDGAPAVIGAGNRDFLITEDRYIINDLQGDIMGFGRETGEFITSYSAKGRAVNEYVGAPRAWLEGDTLKLFDFNTKKIVAYDIDGEYINSEKLLTELEDAPFTILAKYGNGYVGRRCYFGGFPAVAELALYDSEYKFVKDLTKDINRAGIDLGSPFGVANGSDVLYTKYFDTKIFSVESDSLKLKYEVDFMENGIPKDREFVDEYEIIDFVNKDPQRYATLIANLYESEEYLCFTFLTNGNKKVLVHQKKKDISTPVVFTDLEEYAIKGIFFSYNEVLLYLEDEEKSAVLPIKIKSLNL